MQMSMSLKNEPASEPLHIYVPKQLTDHRLPWYKTCLVASLSWFKQAQPTSDRISQGGGTFSRCGASPEGVITESKRLSVIFPVTFSVTFSVISSVTLSVTFFVGTSRSLRYCLPFETRF